MMDSLSSDDITFSIIVPTFNSESCLRHCLEHIQALNYSSSFIELLILDGGSQDHTLEIAREFQATIISCSNINVANSRNIGARSAINDYLVFIDSDCLVHPELLNRAVGHLQQFQIMGSYYKPSPQHGWIAKTWLLAENRISGEVRWLPAGTMILKREHFYSIGTFNESYRADEDSEFCRRARKLGYQIYNDKSVASIHLGQSDSINKFVEKEMWHASSNLRYLQEYGIREEAFSLFLLMFLLACFAVVIYAIATINISTLVFTLIAWSGLSLLFAGIKTHRSRDLDTTTSPWIVLGRLFILYHLYLFARGASLIKYRQFSDISFRQI